ncbi:protein kinase domain-containing protein [Brotaphodocola sp.]|uniref:protein kinase domain-containing protein n=1 Tax=Brotaphodocola sp. TaxID=3073577 RepID=UPI003D7E63D7
MSRCYNCMKEYPDGFDVCPHCGYDRTKENENLYYLNPGTELSNGRYLIGRAINAGGFGIVYKAWDHVLNKELAIKEYFPGGIASRQPGSSEVQIYSEKRIQAYEEEKQRFLNEARTVAKFNDHPNIVDVYDFFEENHTAYMVMEYMDGMNYKEFVRSQGGKVKPQIAVSVALAVLDALREVHKANIIHRDINPNNIFICKSGVVKLFDFGTARIQKMDMTTVLTPGYAPPEQYSTGAKQGAWTDLYAVGATTYYALTGIKPEESTDREQEDHVIPPHEVDAEIPLELSNTIMRAMAVKPELRFQNTEQFRDALMKKKNVRNVEEEIKRRRKIRLIQVTSLTAVFALAGVGLYSQYRSRNEMGTLHSAVVTVWMPANRDESVEEAQQRFDNMTQSFQQEYGQIELQVKVIPEQEYEMQINESAKNGTLPDLFESTELDPSYASNLEPLDMTWQLLASADSSSYLFLDQYENLFPDKKQMPLCFQIPVVYARRDSEMDETKIGEEVRSGYETLRENEDLSYSVKVDDLRLYDQLLGDGCAETYREHRGQWKGNQESDQGPNQNQSQSQRKSEEGYELFKDGQVKFYLSDTSDYRRINEEMGGQYLVILPFEKQFEVRFDHLWSVNANSDENQKKASEWLIYYMLSDQAQNVIGVKSQRGVPLSRRMCEVFADVYEGDLKLKDEIQNGRALGSEWMQENQRYIREWEGNE